jgi:hypothetical protein
MSCLCLYVAGCDPGSMLAGEQAAALLRADASLYLLHIPSIRFVICLCFGPWNYGWKNLCLLTWTLGLQITRDDIVNIP